jgi:protoporphyrinogen/coproporphyrinogen III oxidase
MNDNNRKIIVVGAGLAGLSAAYRLSKAGFEVMVLEKCNRPGGRVKTVHRDNFIIDVGPDAMTEGYRNWQALAKELGLGKDLVYSSPTIGIVRDNKVFDIDTGNRFTAPFTKAFSWPAKLKFALGILRVRKRLVGIDSFRLVESADFDDETETAEGFALRIFGREITDYLIDPMIRLVAGTGARGISRLGVLGALVNWSVKLINLKGGLDRLPLALAAHCTLHLNTEVIEVEETPAGVRITYRDEKQILNQLEADYGVLASTYDVSTKLCPRLTALAPEYEKNLNILSLLSVSLAYSAPTVSKAYVVQVPTVENSDVMLIFLQHNKAPDRVPDGHSLISFYTDNNATRFFIDKNDEEITQWARAQIERLFPELTNRFQFCNVSRWPVAGYVQTPGFWKRTRALKESLQGDSRVQLAGDLFGAGSMESAVTWGLNAADTIIDKQHKDNQHTAAPITDVQNPPGHKTL